MSQKVIIYPGTFDPLTYGHIDIIERGANLGDQLIVAVSLNSGKQPLFTMEERTALVMAVVEEINVNLEGDHHGGGDLRLVADFLSVVRGEGGSISTTTLSDSINSHLIAYAADIAMREERVVSID